MMKVCTINSTRREKGTGLHFHEIVKKFLFRIRYVEVEEGI
jgi:hypothetical protein